MAEFTETFNVEEGEWDLDTWENYRLFIERLRNRLGLTLSHGRPVLPQEVNPPTRFFDVELRTNSNNITLRIRMDTLYLVGYRRADNQWWEFRPENSNDPHRIDGSRFLPFGESYQSMMGDAHVETLSEIVLGRGELIVAVTQLANSMNRRGRSLITVILMINESIRYNSISTYFTTTYHTSSSTPDWMDDQVHSWEDLSAAVQRADEQNSFHLPANNKLQIYTLQAAIALVGIMKGFNFGPGPRRMADDGQQGRPLVEIMSVTINKIDGSQDTYGDIYGTIEVTDGLSSQYIYNREINGSETIHTTETVMLSGPARSISAYGYFILNVALMNKELLSSDNEISKGEISWYAFNTTSNEYDKHLSREISGQYGSATVNYAVLSDAVQATIEVTLIKQDSADVYGLLTAHTTNFSSIESVLFRKAKNKYINLKPGELIPLARSVVPVALNSTLEVVADLMAYNIFSSDDEIAKDILTFPPQLSGTHEQNIYGKDGQIRVMVTWAWYV